MDCSDGIERQPFTFAIAPTEVLMQKLIEILLTIQACIFFTINVSLR